MDLALHTQQLTKTYRRRISKPGLWGSIAGLFANQVKEFPAVKGLDLSVRLGERVGLIGENGAGKSTTLKMLTGILVPTAGSLRVLGKEPWRERRSLAREIGVVFGQRPQLLWDIPVRETFRLLKTMYDVPPAIYDVTYTEAVRRLELSPLLGVPVRQLSLGQRMRCDLAASLLHAPKIAFLDEPTIGLDASVKEQVREFIRDMQHRFGITLLITTHDLKDITETCDRLLLLDRGELLFDGSLPDFERRFGSGRRIRFELEKAVPAQALPELSAALAELGGKLADSGQHQLKVEYEREGAAPQLIQLVMARLAVVDIVLEKADIEGVVARIYRRQAAANASE